MREITKNIVTVLLSLLAGFIFYVLTGDGGGGFLLAVLVSYIEIRLIKRLKLILEEIKEER